MKLLIASGAPHKVEWIKFVVNDLFDEIVSLKDIGYTPKCSEDSDNFKTNAVVKAIEAGLMYCPKGYIVVSDDGGVDIRALENHRMKKLFDPLHSHRVVKDDPVGFNKMILGKVQEMGEPKSSVTFDGACCVAWEEDSIIHHCAFDRSTKFHLRIRDMDPSEVPTENPKAYFDIIERVYHDDSRIALSDMDTLQLLESTGALSIYNQMKYFIRTNIKPLWVK